MKKASLLGSAQDRDPAIRFSQQTEYGAKCDEAGAND
jgi:hypothetical protein